MAAATVVVGLAAATVVEVTATAADEREGWAAARRAVMEAGAALEGEEVGPRVVVLREDGPAGVETEETFRALPTDSGIRSEPLAAG